MHQSYFSLTRPQASVAAISILVLGWRALGGIVHQFFLRRMTILLDLPNIGKPRPSSQRIKGAAVVCGGSIAGLWAARICADHFEEVIIVEPEAWLDSEEGRSPVYDSNGSYIELSRVHSRARVEQYTAAHIFQPLALQALKRLFPNVEERVKEFDGRIAPAEFNLHAFGGHIMKTPVAAYPNGGVTDGFFMSREAYERMLRGLVRDYSSQIRWVTGTVTGLKVKRESDEVKVDAVAVRLPNGEEQTISGSLVIDCTGRSQSGLKWLNRISPYPLEGLRMDYNTVQRYRTYRFTVPPEVRTRLPIPGGYEHCSPWIYTYMPMPGVERKYFVVDKIDGHRVEFGFGGWGDPPLPEDFSELKPYFESFGGCEPVPSWLIDMAEILVEHKDLAKIEGSRFPDNSWIQYEKAPILPSNFVATGDSVMVINPTFGQGCTKACIGAITLDSLLRSRNLKCIDYIPNGFGRQFFKLHAQKITSAWEGTKPTDYQWDTTKPVKGEKLSDEWFSAGFASCIMRLAKTDAHIDSALWHVRSFLAPPTALMQPSILAKVLLLKVKQALNLTA